MSSGSERSKAIDDLVTGMQKGTPPAAPKVKTPWEKAGMSREEWNAGQDRMNQELEIDRLRKNQSHPGNQ